MGPAAYFYDLCCSGMTLRLLLLLFAFAPTARPLAGQGTLLTTATPGEIELENCARINNAETQFGPALYGEDLVFVTRPRRGNVDPVTRKTYFKLFRSPLSREGLPGKPRPFSVELNSNYNEGPVAFTQEDRVIFFTRTQQTGGTAVEDERRQANLGIYDAYRDTYDWTGVRSLPFNGRGFSNQHPTVTPDGRRVFFASNRPGGYGGYDLYFSDKREGRWGPAINLGPEVNTEANEAFPHIHANGQLFFASDGHGGQGGYDLFLIDVGQRRWGPLVNLPAPVNSPADDVGITVAADGRRAYLVSNRSGGMGEDDIYLLRLRNGLASLRGPERNNEALTLYDGTTSQRVANARVWFAEVSPAGRLPAALYSFGLRPGPAGNELLPVRAPANQLPPTELRTGRDGTLRLELTVGNTYEVFVEKPGYEPASLRFRHTADGPSRPLAITLRPAGCRLLAGRVKDRNGGSLEGATVAFRPENCRTAAVETTTDVAGNYEVCLPVGCDYVLVVSRAGYAAGTLPVRAADLAAQPRPTADLSLSPEGNVSRPIGASQGATLTLPGVNFFAGTAVLQRERSADIDLLVRLLTVRPDVQLLLVAHADGPRPAADLERLGDQRANTLRDELVRAGVAPGRLRTLSLGNRQRVRNCTNCTPEDYALNNRMEAKLARW